MVATHCIKPFVLHKHSGVPEVDPELVRFWEKLDFKSRKALLTVDKKALFQRIRNQYCSRCFGLFVVRYDELKCSAQLDCPSEYRRALRPKLNMLCRRERDYPYFVLFCSLSGVLRGTCMSRIWIPDSGRAYCAWSAFRDLHRVETARARARAAVHDRRHLWQWVAEEAWLVHVPPSHKSCSY